MPRPKRPGWSKITLTVSDAVARYIRVQAAERGIEMGTFVDQTSTDPHCSSLIRTSSPSRPPDSRSSHCPTHSKPSWQLPG